jgi:hypothetical protein
MKPGLPLFDASGRPDGGLVAARDPRRRLFCSHPANLKGRAIMLNGYKTYIAGALTILSAVGGYLAGNLTPEAAANLVVPAVLAMTVRHGIAKVAKAS